MYTDTMRWLEARAVRTWLGPATMADGRGVGEGALGRSGSRSQLYLTLRLPPARCRYAQIGPRKADESYVSSPYYYHRLLQSLAH